MLMKALHLRPVSMVRLMLQVTSTGPHLDQTRMLWATPYQEEP